MPIYNLNYGYISILNRFIVEALNKKEVNSLQALDWECAGQSLFMIQLAFGICTVLIVLVENNIFTLGFRPLLKPIKTHLEMIHLSTQRKKVKRVYSIQQEAKLTDIDENKKQEFVEKIDD